MGRVFGYARVSTDKQDTDAQRRALNAAGCVEIIEEQASGRKTRPALVALLDRLEPGDVVTVWKIDRVSRNVADFYRIAVAAMTKEEDDEAVARTRNAMRAHETGLPH